MKARLYTLLEVIFERPTHSGIPFSEIESLIIGLGGRIRQGAGSRVVFELFGKRCYLHRPHPGKNAKRYQVEELREWFMELGVKQ